MLCFRSLTALGGWAVLCSFLLACNKGQQAESPKPKPADKLVEQCEEDCEAPVVSDQAKDQFQEALNAFVERDRAGDWNAKSCAAVAEMFGVALDRQKKDHGAPIPEAHYNAGLAYQRCTMDEEAKKSFAAANKLDPEFHRARAQMALYEFKETGNLDGAISALDKIILDAKFQNAGGLVALASLQMVRHSDAEGNGCENDLACAHLNLQRALALDDGFMPAFNQLALYYLEQARGESGGERSDLIVASSQKTRLNKQRLDLASLVASQALKKNPNYAPIHNTIGLLLVELRNYNGAVKAFAQARAINPNLFEAQMNYAAVNLSFRGFGEASAAYRAALKLHPETYEAHLGLALALRGLINDRTYEKNVAEAQKHLDEAKRIEPARPEAYYNEAILTEEFRAKQAGAGKEQVAMWKEQIAVFRQASKQYEAFIERAGEDPAFADAVRVSRERIQDITDTLKFMEESVAMAQPSGGK